MKVLVTYGGHTFENSFFTMFKLMEKIDFTFVELEENLFNRDLSKYDVILMYHMTNNITDIEKENLLKFLESDKGLIILHSAIANYSSWNDWGENIIGGKYLFQETSTQPSSQYIDHQEIIASPRGEHPITSFLHGTPTHILDETYVNLWYSPNIEIILSTSLFTSDRPIMWINEYQNSRVVSFIPGHGRSAHYNFGYIKLLENAIQWSAKSSNSDISEAK